MSSGFSLLDRRIGHNIRENRLRRGLTQATLGAVIGVSTQQVQKYEKGTNRISANHLYALALALRVPIQRMFQPSIQTDESVPAMLRWLKHRRVLRLS